MGRSRSRSRAQSGASDARSSRAPSLTSSERAYMIRKAKEASVALVDHAHTLDGPVQWHYTGKFRGIQMYRGEGSYDRVGTAGTEFLCGVTTMMGTIEEVAAYFNQQTTDKMVAKKADDVLDCGVLYNLVQNEPQNPFYRVSAKYLLYEGPSAFSRERDYCFLECQNTFRHASGRRGWVLSMHSIKLPCCPEVDGVVRGSMYQSGYVFVEAEKDGYMDVMHSLQINFKSTSRLPHFLLNSALKRRILSVVTVSREIQSSRMGRQTLLKKKQLMPKRARALCVNCSRKFSLFVRKTRCRVCGEVVCQPCAPQVLISVSRGPPVKTRVCNKCYHLSPKDEYEPVGALPGQQMDPRRMQNETRYSDILQDHNDGVYHEADEDSLDEDEDEDGLEEQSDYSVFAQSRFTEASRDSVATTNRFDADDGASSIYSGTSTSYWQQESSVASSMVDWNQASSVQPADGFIYDPQASQMSSNFFGASNFTADEDYGKQTGNHYNSTAFDSTAFNSTAYNSTAPIPEDEPASHSGNGHDDSYASNTSSNKILSIQQIAKARSARYGINSQFPPPPPPPPLSPPPEEEDEEDEGGSVPLDAGSLRAHNLMHSSGRKKDRSAGGSRKMFTPERSRNSLKGSNRGHKAPRQKELHSAAVRNDEGTRVSHIDSKAFGNTRSSAILQQMRRNRNRTLQFTPESDRESAVLKSLEEEHLSRMHEIERMQELARQKAARRSIASNGSQRSSMQRSHPTNGGVRLDSDRTSAAGVENRSRRANSPRGPPPGSPRGPPPPRSPPGRPRKAQGRAGPRTPPQSPPSRSNTLSSNRGNSSFGERSRRTDRSSNASSLQRSQFSTRSNGTFTKSAVRVSVAPSEQMEDLTFSSQRSGGGYRISATPSKGSNSSLGDRRFDASQCSSIPYSEQADDLTFDASQLSLDQSKFSSSVAILETPDESARKSVAMMERNSAQRSSDDSTLFGDDLANRSTEDMTEHINSMRARNAYQLPDEDVRPSEDLQKREVEHRKRMEELARLTGNHVVEDDVRNRASSLGGLHDSAVSLTGFRNGGNSSPNQNHLDSSLMDSSMLDSSMLTSSTLGSSMVDTSLMDSTISTDEFDFESRPLGRTKRSGTIPFSLDEMHYTPAPVEEEPLSEPEDENVSEGVSEGLTDRASERLSQGLSERSSEASVGISEGFSERPSARLSQGLSERSSEAVSEGISECTSERASEGPSERPSERISERASGRLSEAISEGVSEGVSERSSDIASERSSERSRGLSAEESVAAVHSVSTDKFQPYSSQLVPGEGGAAVDEFFADESRVAPTSKLSQVDESDEEGSDSDRSHHKEENLEFMPSVDEHTPEESSPANPVKQPVTISTSSTEASERVSSPRESCVSDMSELDEDLMNRPTDLIYEQVRANRTRKWQPSASTAELHDSDRCSDIMYDIEESHRRRMEELNRIAVDHLGNRISNLDDELFDSSYRPGRALPSSVNENEVDDMQWRSTNDMDQYHSKHMQELDALRRKIRQLEEECRESLASVLTAEEMDLSEFDDETPADATDFSTSRVNDNSSQVPANAMGSSFVSADAMGSSFVSTNSLDMSSTQPMPPQLDEPVSARVLYEQIAQLTQLQREMAMAEDDADEEEYRARIKEQYRLLRTIKVHGRR